MVQSSIIWLWIHTSTVKLYLLYRYAVAIYPAIHHDVIKWKHFPRYWPFVRGNSPHYTDVIMTTMASQITSLTVVYSIVYSGGDQRKHQSSDSLALCGEFTGTGEFPAQRASNAENVFIWWRHHGSPLSFISLCNPLTSTTNSFHPMRVLRSVYKYV